MKRLFTDCVNINKLNYSSTLFCANKIIALLIIYKSIPEVHYF